MEAVATIKAGFDSAQHRAMALPEEPFCSKSVISKAVNVQGRVTVPKAKPSESAGFVS